MTYRPGYSEEHSPYYQAGFDDGSTDREREVGDPVRSYQADRAWSQMYQRGYRAGLGGPKGSEETPEEASETPRFGRAVSYEPTFRGDRVSN